MPGKKFEDLPVWKDSRELSRYIFDIGRRSSLRKEYSFRNHIERTAVSIMANIAEGYERDGDKELVQYLSQAKGSAGELRSHLYVALDKDLIESEEFNFLSYKAMSISKQLSGLIRYIRKSDLGGRKFKT
jgi:four helix bundle protein